MKITLPIYFQRRRRIGVPIKVLLGLNWYRNAHFRVTGPIKKAYHELVKKKMGDAKFNKIRLKYDVYLSRNNTDGSNVRSVIEKFFLDGLVECGAIPNDNMKYVVGDEANYHLDRDDPRIEIEIIEIT